MRETKARILYLCDGEKEDCRKRSCYKTIGDNENPCRHTADITHAKNFKQAYPDIPSSAYREQETAPDTGAVSKEWRTKIKENLKNQGFLSWCSLIVAVLALLKVIFT